MPRLLHDRYFAYDARHGWDLATGERVRLDDLSGDTIAHQPPLRALVEALDHGREGVPRWIVADAPPGWKNQDLVRRVAADARARGFIAVDVEVYLRLHSLAADDLRGRALLLVSRPGAPLEAARTALVEAAAASTAPHILLSFRTAPDGGRPLYVREARAVYGPHALEPTNRSATLTADASYQLARASRAREYLRTGRHASAERLLRDVAAALTRRRAAGPAAQVALRLGRLLLDRGRAVAAEGVFEEAAIAARTAGDESLVLESCIWRALARTDAAQLTAAESLVRAVIAGGTLPPAHRAWADAALARVLFWQGRVDEAAALDPRAPAVGDIDEAVAIWAGATGVRVLLGIGETFMAGQRARELIVRAGVSGEPLCEAVALTAHLRVLTAMGDLALAQECVTVLGERAREARAPLRGVAARLIWLDALRRAGRTREAERECGQLRRLHGVMPPLLRHAIEQRLRNAGPPAVNGRAAMGAGPISSAAAALVARAQEEEHDREAVRRVLEFSADALKTSRIDLCSADAGPVSVLMSVGSGLATALGPRVLDAGIAIRSESALAGHEAGVPVRLGSKLVAALVGRWPVDRSPSSHAQELLELAAAVAAPRVDAMTAAARDAAQACASIPELVGASAAMADVRKAVARAAAAPFSVLIEGESGVGKELVARAIHHLSPRRQRRFCDVNCAALPDDLLDSELFGHARGAFTGAVAERAGLFEDADGGTLFLDEVADLSARGQAKLLRVLQQHEIRRLGETFTRKVDVRIVCAANRDMRPEAEQGRFRQDLLYRLDVIRIRMPPLRERPEDVAVLARHFWRTAAERVGTTASLTHGAVVALSRYGWPGNVRELQNVLSALAVAAPPRGRVSADLLPAVITGAAAITSPRLADARTQFERRFIEVALARAGGRRSRAARELGLTRQGLLKMMARLGIDARPSPGSP